MKLMTFLLFLVEFSYSKEKKADCNFITDPLTVIEEESLEAIKHTPIQLGSGFSDKQYYAQVDSTSDFFVLKISDTEFGNTPPNELYNVVLLPSKSSNLAQFYRNIKDKEIIKKREKFIQLLQESMDTHQYLPARLTKDKRYIYFNLRDTSRSDSTIYFNAIYDVETNLFKHFGQVETTHMLENMFHGLESDVIVTDINIKKSINPWRRSVTVLFKEITETFFAPIEHKFSLPAPSRIEKFSGYYVNVVVSPHLLDDNLVFINVPPFHGLYNLTTQTQIHLPFEVLRTLGILHRSKTIFRTQDMLGFITVDHIYVLKKNGQLWDTQLEKLPRSELSNIPNKKMFKTFDLLHNFEETMFD